MKKYSAILLYLVLILVFPIESEGKNNDVAADTRCPVCGMFVAKYPQWQASVTDSNEKVYYFDGVKDLMAYYFSPSEFGAGAGDVIKDIAVKDYYTQKWFDGKTAWFVVGSDVLGPMGHELVPFSSQAAAENFFKDHHGKEILQFTAIDAKRIHSMRQGHKMKMMKK